MPANHVRKYAPGKRPKTGGRQKGTPNKSTVLRREMWIAAFHELQRQSPGHFLAWARQHPGEFYKIFARSSAVARAASRSAPVGKGG